MKITYVGPYSRGEVRALHAESCRGRSYQCIADRDQQRRL